MNSKEPAVLGAAFAALVNALAIFVFNSELSDDQTGAIVVTVTVLAGFFIRSKVTPVAQMDLITLLIVILIIVILLRVLGLVQVALGAGEYRSGGGVVDSDGRPVVVVVAAVLPIIGTGPDARDADGRRVLKVG